MLIALGMKWSRAEILALPEPEFRFYIRKLTEKNK